MTTPGGWGLAEPDRCEGEKRKAQENHPRTDREKGCFFPRGEEKLLLKHVRFHLSRTMNPETDGTRRWTEVRQNRGGNESGESHRVTVRTLKGPGSALRPVATGREGGGGRGRMHVHDQSWISFGGRNFETKKQCSSS